MLWGVILWFLAQVMVMPMMGMGVFSSRTPEPAMAVLGSLMGHLIYGAILGALAGVQALRLPRVAHQS
jgi:vacuolar-type H+-ATPase subunit I/STV1